jgi:hypothetical protein
MRALHPAAPIGLMVCSVLVFGNADADAYDLRTHGSISDRSFDASQGTARYLNEMGIGPDDVFDRPAVTPPGQLADFTNLGTVRGWLTEGAIREDDYQPHPLLETIFGCEPPLNPPSAIDRPVHHFFDVQRGGAGLTLSGGLPAPDWALGVQGRGPANDQNHFSLPDARVYQVRALTESSRDGRDRNTALLFRTLGHVIHVLQDMAQPQHTRNDPHPRCDSTLLRFVTGDRSWYEAYVEKRATNQPYRGRGVVPLVLSGYGPVGFQRYHDYWANVSGTGLAEFSSRNFFSARTNLGAFSLLGDSCGGLPQPVCEPGAYRTEDFEFTTPTLSGDPLTGRVRFFLRDLADPLTGQVVQDVRVSSRSLWDQHLETNQQRPKFSLNTYTYDSIADVLLPRAVGYSAGFLDYFFRGRLDVDLVPDGADFDTVRVSGVNGSLEALAGGTLTLHADDASGRRSPAPPLDADLTITAAPGAALTSARFRLPPDTERSMAVYQGRLGNEAPAPSLPGTVIGRTLGGVRVEEVFLDFASDPSPTWKLRTPKGLFPLNDADRGSPLTWHDFDDVRWGDGDDQLVGRTRFGAGRPNRVTAYTIPRLAGAVEVVTANTPDGPAVNLVRLADWVLPPGGIALGTTLSLSYTIDFRQQLVAYERTSRFLWTVPFPGVPGSYVAAPVETTSPTVRTVAGLTVPFADTFDIVLDPTHYDLRQSPTDGATYSWTLSDVSATAAGRLVGLIRVDHAPPPFFRWSRVNQPVYGLDPTGALIVLQTCSSLSCFPLTVSVTREFPVGRLLWAVVELETGRVLARTADDRVTTAAHAAVEAPNWLAPGQSPRPIIYRHNFERYEGGQDDPRTIDLGWSGEGVRGWDGQVFSTLTPLALHPESGQTTSGMFRTELAGALGIFLQQRPGQPAFTRTHAFGDSGPDQKLLEVSVPATGPAAVPIFLGHALRARPAPGTERLVLIAEGLMPEQRTMDAVLVWDPATARAAALHASPIGPEGARLSLSSATTSAALVPALGEGGGYLVSLDGVGPPRFLPDPADALSSYRLLAPRRLYNVLTERFHRIVATPDGTLLQITAVPLVLKDGPGGPIGDYHALRLP